MPGDLIRRGNTGAHKETCSEGDPAKTEAEAGAVNRECRRFQGPPDTGKSQKGFFPGSTHRKHTPLTP